MRQIRFHDLRQTTASLLIHNRESITRVQAVLGHSSPAITLAVYSHILPMEDTGASDRLSS